MLIDEVRMVMDVVIVYAGHVVFVVIRHGSDNSNIKGCYFEVWAMMLNIVNTVFMWNIDTAKGFWNICSHMESKEGLTIAAAKDVAVSHINAAFTYDICTVRTRKVTTIRVKKVCTVRIIREKVQIDFGLNVHKAWLRLWNPEDLCLSKGSLYSELSRQMISPAIHFYAGEWEELLVVLSVMKNDIPVVALEITLSFSKEDFTETYSSHDDLGRGYNVILMIDIPTSATLLKKLYALLKKASHIHQVKTSNQNCTMVRAFSQKHIYKHPWEGVTSASWCKFADPENKRTLSHMLEFDTLNHKLLYHACHHEHQSTELRGGPGENQAETFGQPDHIFKLVYVDERHCTLMNWRTLNNEIDDSTLEESYVDEVDSFQRLFMSSLVMKIGNIVELRTRRKGVVQPYVSKAGIIFTLILDAVGTDFQRLAEVLEAEIKRWSSGKQASLCALLSSLQYILGSHSD
ncbi:hypothetical protein Tco_0233640 [Tanacetum coccineum]